MSQLKGATAGHGGAAAHSSREPFALSDQQWTALAPLVPGADSVNSGRLAAPQRVVEGILYAIRNGMGMQSVQPPYPSGSTLYRRYTAWTASGHWDAIWAAFLETLSPAERGEWEAASRRRPGAAEAADQPAPPAPASATPAAAAADSAVTAASSAATDVPGPVLQATKAVLPPARVSEVGSPRDAAARQPDAQRNGHTNQAHVGEQRNGQARPGDAPATAFEPSAQPPHVTLDAAHDWITRRLDLSAAESDIVRRRIDDHGVSAALLALDEVEGRLATGMMRGVGGMPMSAFEIWVCAVGLARRPVERPRAPRPERGDQNDTSDRRKRQWRKAP